jgi:polyisoprenoid-binding protein YceI
MATRYRLDPTQSRFTVQAFATGMLGFLGHSPTFAVREFSGTGSFEDGTVKSMRLELTVRANGLHLLDNIRPADRTEMEDSMRRDVLETARYPEIRYEAPEVLAETVAQGRYRLRIGGRLSLHGVARLHPVDAEMVVFTDGLRLRGESSLRLSDHAIRPVTALGGTIRLKDELQLVFDIAGLPEES